MGQNVLNYIQTATILNIVKNELQKVLGVGGGAGGIFYILGDEGRQNERRLILIYELVQLICKMG